MSISALGKKCSECCTVCSGIKYATHRSHSSVLQDYLYVLCTLVCEKPPRSASLNEIVHPPLKHIVRWCRHFVSYVEYVTTSVTQRSVSANSLKIRWLLFIPYTSTVEISAFHSDSGFRCFL